MRIGRVGFGNSIGRGFDNGRGEDFCKDNGSGTGDGYYFYNGDGPEYNSHFTNHGNGYSNYPYILIQY